MWRGATAATRANKRAPFEGRAPLDLLRGSLDDQLAVRLYASAIGYGGALPNEIDPELSPVAEQKIVWDDARPQIRAVCFDGFGTLVDIADKRRPFKALLGDSPPSDLITKVLTQPTGLREVARGMSFAPDEESIAALEAWLETELASTRLRQGMDSLWEALRRIGLRVGVCSNLASPYGHALLGCLPRVPDALVLSFRFGKAKPQLEIYQQVCAEFGLEPRHILFIGDRVEEDVLGPQRAGLFAMHIDEFETALAQGTAPSTPSAIVELVERLAEFIQEPRVLPLSPKDAIDTALSHVNAVTMIGHGRDHLLHVLRSPSSVMEGDDHALKQLLCAFICETDETLLIQIAGGGEIGWPELSKAAHATLLLGHSLVVEGLWQSYVVAGRGPVCVVHPGGLGAEWHYLRMPLLEDRLTMVYLEPIGTGASDRLAGHPFGYSVERYSQQLSGFLATLDLRDVFLLGHSHGGEP